MVYHQKVQTGSGLTPATIATRRGMLVSFGKFLAQQDPQDGLRAFLLRYESAEEVVRSRALAEMVRFVNLNPSSRQRSNRSAKPSPR